jgi:two-component system alkaline phosphatase synthesis response regulator PhoP
MLELLARVEALLRRVPSVPSQPQEIYRFGSIRVDFSRTQVTHDGELLELSAREFKLLRCLIEHRGAMVSRDELLNEVWGYDALTSTRTIDVHVSLLRQKIEPDSRHHQFILTMHGYGYKFSG